jgi:hypothetical protein
MTSKYDKRKDYTVEVRSQWSEYTGGKVISALMNRIDNIGMVKDGRDSEIKHIDKNAAVSGRVRGT